MKKGKGKGAGVKKIYTTELIDYKVNKKPVIKKEKNIPQLLKKPSLSENNFLGLYRQLKTYDERKEELEKRNYKLVKETWSDDLKNTESSDFYFNTMTINKKGQIEIWIKRKSFTEIKHLLIKRGMIFGDNPFEEYIVLGDDMKTEHIFYRKNKS